MPTDSVPVGTLFRQGDILLLAIPTPGDLAMLDRQKGLVLARGEATGHGHVFERGSRVTLFRPKPRFRPVPESDERFSIRANDLVVQVMEPSNLCHPEHCAIAVPSGWYRVWRQREAGAGSWQTVGD